MYGSSSARDALLAETIDAKGSWTARLRTETEEALLELKGIFVSVTKFESAEYIFATKGKCIGIGLGAGVVVLTGTATFATDALAKTGAGVGRAKGTPIRTAEAILGAVVSRVAALAVISSRAGA